VGLDVWKGLIFSRGLKFLNIEATFLGAFWKFGDLEP
jgi:hypothetical protein